MAEVNALCVSKMQFSHFVNTASIKIHLQETKMELFKLARRVYL